MTPGPRWLLPAAIVSLLVVVGPLVGLLGRVDWVELPALLTSESSLAALWLSLRTAVVSTLLCLVLGTPLAVVLARAPSAGWVRWLRGLVLLPLVLPPVVGGLALLATFGRTGLVGRHLEASGVHIAFTTIAVVLAQTFVAMPFLVVGLEGALRTGGTRYERAAATLGASPTRVLAHVTLPLAWPGLRSGATLAFARCLGEFGATLTFAGSLQGVTRTLPLEIYLQREVAPDAAMALSLALVVVAVLIVGITYDTGGSTDRRGEGA
ncbi:ABC transporter permease [Mobilicoccus pelagius]|uniref:Molybdenum transport system permease n=1 Tax=Mobilicoccus pelagius NBRC 104925 TaxID=1089455 RepID=H5URE6_9MICO|nr:ABC transporter permease [Mobilicoccus pelagius]GAB48304.1 molybdate ABC transporter permease protein [Mobilicoccus pelagius NBRC 104925]